MNLFARTALVLGAAAAGIAAIGYTYTRCVQPYESVWLVEFGEGSSDMVRWLSMPLGVSWDDDFDEAARYALDDINGRVGCLLFVQGRPGTTVSVRGADGEPCGQARPLATTERAGAFLCPGGLAEIQISMPGDISQQRLIIEHELLHVLGLAHDDFTASIMYRDPRDGARITDKDAAALAARYCKKGE